MAEAANSSELGKRTLSALVMLGVAGTALWLAGWYWAGLVAICALGVLWEWLGLARRFCGGALSLALWMTGGLVYIGLAAGMLMLLNSRFYDDRAAIMLPLGAVVATDIGAYFAGRFIGGPKIAPAISPSKTWAGLFGGMVAAAVVALAVFPWSASNAAILTWQSPFVPVLIGCGIAIVAQSGDFFESWMKRRAGVKDSGHLIPGHGGLFDRADGLLAVMFIGALGLILRRFVMGIP